MITTIMIVASHSEAYAHTSQSLAKKMDEALEPIRHQIAIEKAIVWLHVKESKFKVIIKKASKELRQGN